MLKSNNLSNHSYSIFNYFKIIGSKFGTNRSTDRQNANSNEKHKIDLIEFIFINFIVIFIVNNVFAFSLFY